MSKCNVSYVFGTDISFCLQSAERRQAVLSSLVRYLGPEAASFIHYEEKVSGSLADVWCNKNNNTWFGAKFNTAKILSHIFTLKPGNAASCWLFSCCGFLWDVLANVKQIVPDVHLYWSSCPLISTLSHHCGMWGCWRFCSPCFKLPLCTLTEPNLRPSWKWSVTLLHKYSTNIDRYWH